MNRLSGWLTERASQSMHQTFTALTQRLEKTTGESSLSWSSSVAALVVAGDSGRAALYAQGPYSVGLIGAPRWDGRAHSDEALVSICRAFLDRYQAVGTDALAMLQGEFAVVLLDDAKHEAVLAIDRFGIGNIVFQADANGLIFGSTCDELLQHPRGSREIEPQSIYDYVYFHVVPAPSTIYQRQQRLLPGRFVRWSPNRWSMDSYWRMTFPERAGTVADFKAPFREVLRIAVSGAAEDANCGAFLSGGTDSSTVAGVLSSLSASAAKTYSIGFAESGYDEMEYARIASKHFRTEHHEYYVTADDVVAALPSIVGAYDQPFGNASAVAAYYCALSAKADGVTRMLAGDGGDELFGGNTRYAKQYWLSLYKSVPESIRRALEPLVLEHLADTSPAPLRKLRSYVAQACVPMPARYQSHNLVDRLGSATIFTPEFLSRIDVSKPAHRLAETHRDFQNASLINQMLGIDLKFTLADSDLPKVTRMCELAGVEVAFPLLDERVADFSAQLPANLKLRRTRLRYFFKQALRDFLPAEILRKQKHGFGLPVGPWLTTHDRLMQLAGDSLTSLKRRQIIAPAFIDRLLEEHLRAHSAYFGTMAWVLMMLELWFQRSEALRCGSD